jgi:hypothetical protein
MLAWQQALICWHCLQCPAFAFVAALLLCLARHPAVAASVEAPPYRPSGTAQADAPGRGLGGTVQNRPRPDYDPIGVPLGAFRMYPSIGIGLDYDSNVYRTDGGERGDLLARVRPAVRIGADWSRYALEASIEAESWEYAVHRRERYLDAATRIAGRIDIRRGLQFEAGLGLAHLHEPRGDVDGDGNAEPITFLRWTGEAAVALQSGRFGYSIGGTYRRLDFNDVPATGGGSLNQDDRDRQTWTVEGRIGYDPLPDTELYVAGRYGLADFTASTDDSGINRDSRTQQLVVGTALDLGGITILNLAIGWMAQQFADSRLQPAMGLAASGNATVNVTALTTVTGTLARDLNATVTSGASAYTQTNARLKVDHELLRNLLLSASVAARRLAFHGIDRQDTHWGASLAGEWLINRMARISLQYDFGQRLSEGDAATHDWQRHAVMLRLELQR